jgi:hypothetical protein
MGNSLKPLASLYLVHFHPSWISHGTFWMHVILRHPLHPLYVIFNNFSYPYLFLFVFLTDYRTYYVIQAVKWINK